jgi:hypothetical protein
MVNHIFLYNEELVDILGFVDDTVLTPLRACSCAFLFLQVESLLYQYTMCTQGMELAFFSFFSLFRSFRSRLRLRFRCFSFFFYAVYDHQTRSHQKTQTENETVYVLSCASLCPFLDDYLETSNVSLGYDCVNGRDESGESVEIGSANDADLCLLFSVSLDLCRNSSLSRTASLGRSLSSRSRL